MKNLGCTPIIQVPSYPARALGLLLLLGLLLAPPPAASAQSRTTRGTFIIAVATNTPPFAVQADNGQLVGFDLDLTKLLVRTAGLRVAYEAVPFIQLIPGVATRLYDAAVGCIVTNEERKTLVDFSSPYFTTGKVFAFSENSPPIYDLTDLTPEITLSVMAESAAWSFLTEQNIATAVTATTPAAALELAAARVTNAAFVDEISADLFRRAHPEAHLQVVSGLVTTDQCAIAVSKENPQLLLELNAAMTRLKNNGKYLAIYRRWFGSRPLSGPPPVSRPTPLTEGTQGATPAAPAADMAIGAYTITLLTEPSAYQLIELTSNGLWLESSAGPDAEAMPGVRSLTTGQLPVQQGRWQAVRTDPIALTIEISATVQLSAITTDNANEGIDSAASAPPLQPHEAYQLTIQGDGAVRGAYTLFARAMPTTTMLTTTTVEFVGQRVIQ
jgi:glutamine transport system substrate-binding protein